MSTLVATIYSGPSKSTNYVTSAVDVVEKVIAPRVLITEEDLDLTVDIDSDVEDSIAKDHAHYSTCCADKEEAFVYRCRLTTKMDTMERWEKKKYLEIHGVMKWLEWFVVVQRVPVQRLLSVFHVHLSKEYGRKLDDLALLPVLKTVLVHHLKKRNRFYHKPALRHLDVSSVLREISVAKNIVVLTGAGISTSCGIPDFRSRDGLYSQFASSGLYDFDDPQQMFDINYFRRYPDVFYSFAHKIYPSNFKPSPCHRFIKVLENRNKLLRNYTQNIDTLEQKAGIKRVLHCHGSFQSASCINCHVKVPGHAIEEDLMASRVPVCKCCNDAKSLAKLKRPRKKKKKKKRNDGWESDDDDYTPPLPPGIMKPDITFFGEKLSNKFDKKFFEDLEKIDLLLIIGTSLKVRPVSEIPSYVLNRVPKIVINKTPIEHVDVDLQLIGDADIIVEHLAYKLRWDIPPSNVSNSELYMNGQVQRKQRAKHSREKHRIILFEGYDEENVDVQEVIPEMSCGDSIDWDCTDSEEEKQKKVRPRTKQTARKSVGNWSLINREAYVVDGGIEKERLESSEDSDEDPDWHEAEHDGMSALKRRKLSSNTLDSAR